MAPGRGSSRLTTSDIPLNISKPQQRVLHALAQGGRIDLMRENGKLVGVECWSHEGWLLSDCTLALFKRLKRQRLIASTGGGPYRITRHGLSNLRAHLNNRLTGKGW